MSSVYSLPNRQNFEEIPLRNLNRTQQTEWPVYQAMQTEGRRKWMTIIILAILAFILAASTATLGALLSKCEHSLQTPQNDTSQTPGNDTASTPVTITTTKIATVPSTTTTKTVPPATQTAVHTVTEVSYVTTEFTKSSVLTTSVTYGGQELHDLNNDYDLLMVDALEFAVSNGLDLGGDEYMDVAMRSIFLCSSSDSIELVEAFIADSVLVVTSSPTG
ncbi:hypothetical protein J7T55_003876 [Diaporthe amygdali]|uniref:uncharacterized protein n=1 Tax=Phomopsis amygdali TaxID=1214568 RepID=UPI0022FF3278|nr:uncharacterized protein J7T55_003876 [Diaporthe amygdali]KAJ0117460.1 hypothetical protein J7T55_003876 [Diaporthe amygdali]